MSELMVAELFMVIRENDYIAWQVINLQKIKSPNNLDQVVRRFYFPFGEFLPKTPCHSRATRGLAYI